MPFCGCQTTLIGPAIRRYEPMLVPHAIDSPQTNLQSSMTTPTTRWEVPVEKLMLRLDLVLCDGIEWIEEVRGNRIDGSR
jgi:hypothetical protein